MMAQWLRTQTGQNCQQSSQARWGPSFALQMGRTTGWDLYSVFITKRNAVCKDPLALCCEPSTLLSLYLIPQVNSMRQYLSKCSE